MNILENRQEFMKNRCKTFGKLLRILFWGYLIVSTMLLLFWGICAFAAPASAFAVEQFGSDAKVGFRIGGRGLYFMVTNTSFHMGEYSCKALYGIVWIMAWGYGALSAAILWCLASVFRRIQLDEGPFTLSCSRFVRYMGLLFLGLFVYKNVIEAAVLFILGPSTARTALINNLELALIGGIVLCLSYVFEYGVVLQQQADETL